jgi:xanthine dehydrogenase YagR molybdenum-binding subunit
MARVVICSSGTAIVQAPACEMGMGTATAQIQHAADRLGLPLHGVSFHYGDSNLSEHAYVGGRLEPDRHHFRSGAGCD